MGKLRRLAFSAGILLLVLSMTVFYINVRDFLEIRPASDYSDRGVHIFEPYQTYPTQVKNTASGRQQRMHPTKTVYLVYYKATDGSGYQWKDRVEYRAEAEHMVSEKKPVQRRVLAIKETKSYISIEADSTAETYTADLRRNSVTGMGLSAAYMVLFGAGWIVILRKRRPGSR